MSGKSGRLMRWLRLAVFSVGMLLLHSALVYGQCAM